MIRFHLLFLLISICLSAQNLESYRSNFFTAVTNKSICSKMIEELKNHQSESIYKAYLGAYETIWANHAWNPMSKLNTFNQGKSKIEKAVLSSPENIEIKFLRYSIQKNAPKFLNYSKDLEKDKNFILKNQHLVKDESLKNLLKNLN